VTTSTTPIRRPSARRPALTTQGLTRRFGDVEALPPIDLELEPGDRLALRGPNGSGKTTLLRCLTGTLIPSGGEAWIGPHPAGTLGARERLGASLAVERSFYLRLTGRANLLLFARLRHRTSRQARRQVDALIEELELEEIAARRLDACSTGMVQQVAFARALLGDPDVLLLDEPTRSLDREAIERLWAALNRRMHLAAIVASHRLDDASRCGRSLELGR
jgi:ABC-type multidrug transport system ATPase subunit